MFSSSFNSHALSPVRAKEVEAEFVRLIEEFSYLRQWLSKPEIAPPAVIDPSSLDSRDRNPMEVILTLSLSIWEMAKEVKEEVEFMESTWIKEADDLRRELDKVEKEITQQNKEIESLEEFQDEVVNIANAREDRILDLGKQTQAHADENDALARSLADAKAALEKAGRIVNDRGAAIISLEQELEYVEGKYDALAKELGYRKLELKNLKKDVGRKTDFQEAVRALSRKYENVERRVAELQQQLVTSTAPLRKAAYLDCLKMQMKIPNSLVAAASKPVRDFAELEMREMVNTPLTRKPRLGCSANF